MILLIYAAISLFAAYFIFTFIKKQWIKAEIEDVVSKRKLRNSILADVDKELSEEAYKTARTNQRKLRRLSNSKY